MKPDGSLGALVLAAGLRADRQPKEPKLGFSSADTAVNAFVSLGEDAGNDEQLVVAWYRLKGTGEREHLFSHKVDAMPGLARSQGVAPAGLAPGIYETVATVGDLQVRTPWVVAEASRRAASPESAESLEVPHAGASSSGATSSSSSSQGGAGNSGDPCSFSNLSGSFAVLLWVSAFWSGDCSVVAVAASFRGPPVILQEEDVSENRNRFGVVSAETQWICALPGASDLPGAVIRLTALDEEFSGLSKELTLGDVGEVLRAALSTEPPRGFGVKRGERIEIAAMALLGPPALGVERLDLTVNGAVIESVGNFSGSSEPVACDFGRLFALLEARYRVPTNSPPVIRICAEALGFDGTRSSDCAQFYIGEVWTGTAYGTIKVVPPGLPGVVCPNPVEWTGYVQFVVAPEGQATGSIELHGARERCALRSSRLVGVVNDQGVRFPHLEPLFIDGPIPIVSPGRAKGRFTHTVAGTTKYSTRWNLKCKTCDD